MSVFEIFETLVIEVFSLLGKLPCPIGQNLEWINNKWRNRKQTMDKLKKKLGDVNFRHGLSGIINFLDMDISWWLHTANAIKKGYCDFFGNNRNK